MEPINVAHVPIDNRTIAVYVNGWRYSTICCCIDGYYVGNRFFKNSWDAIAASIPQYMIPEDVHHVEHTFSDPVHSSYVRPGDYGVSARPIRLQRRGREYVLV